MRIGHSTILEHVISRLKLVGVSEVAINLHHFPEQIIDYLNKHDNFGLKVHLSHEHTLLDTGGGLNKLSNIFHGERAFIVHNSDIYCTHDLTSLLDAHITKQAVATLGIMERASKRGIYFDSSHRLTGRTQEKSASPIDSTLYAFSGVSVCSSDIFNYMNSPFIDSRDAFSIIESFLAAARATGRVFGSIIPSNSWVDIGTPDRLTALQRELGS